MSQEMLTASEFCCKRVKQTSWQRWHDGPMGQGFNQPSQQELNTNAVEMNGVLVEIGLEKCYLACDLALFHCSA
ncbi:hypothetical protein CCACVL1_04521 [Corchorus capsularis]|uniref:Uncharacterized protein n=1 Tax=Corchorus capsularis TaxID=210143 RepID=A0A1R3JRL8_COCAP|nr:hypothetical protein CCACVL1_04521 [Corchorus capsularis]